MIFKVEIETAHPTTIYTFYVQAKDKEDAQRITTENEDELLEDFADEGGGDTLTETTIKEVPEVPSDCKVFKEE